MASATAEREDWVAAFKTALGEKDLGAMLDAIRAQMDTREVAAPKAAE